MGDEQELPGARGKRISPIFKKDSSEDCANYRPISLLKTITKWFYKIIYILTAAFWENVLGTQVKFVKNRSTIDHPLTIFQALEKNGFGGKSQHIAFSLI